MSLDYPEPRSEVVSGLSSIIASELMALAHEHWMPRMASDQSDSELAFRKLRLDSLRKIRADFENLMFGLEAEVV